MTVHDVVLTPAVSVTHWRRRVLLLQVLLASVRPSTLHRRTAAHAPAMGIVCITSALALRLSLFSTVGTEYVEYVRLAIVTPFVDCRLSPQLRPSNQLPYERVAVVSLNPVNPDYGYTPVHSSCAACTYAERVL